MIIVPAGNNKIDWSPRDQEKLQRTASTEGQEQEIQEEVNPLYEAAKNFVEAAEEKKCDECECDPCKCEKKKAAGTKEAGAMCDDDEAVIEVEEVEEVEDTGETPKSVSEAVAEVEEEAAKAAEVIEKVKECVEKIEEAVQEVKDAAGVAGEEVVEDLGVEVVEDIPGEVVEDSEVIVEGDETSACMAGKREVVMDKSAATEEEFCRFAKLSPSNRKKLADYWTNMLGYPKDYVALMTKDYEK